MELYGRIYDEFGIISSELHCTPYWRPIKANVRFKSGGTTTTNTQDLEYNARMATIAEKELGMAEWYDQWMKGEVGTDGGPSYIDLQNAMIGANAELVPAQTALQKEQLASEQSLLPGQTALTSEQVAAQRELLPGQMSLTKEQVAAQRELLPGQMSLTKEQVAAQRELLPGQTALASSEIAGAQEKIGYQRELMPTYFNKINKGLDVKGRMGEASADVVKAYSGMEDQTRRQAARMGMSPSSSRTLSRLTDVNLNRSRDIAFARTNARRTAETENISNLRQAMTT